MLLVTQGSGRLRLCHSALPTPCRQEEGRVHIKARSVNLDQMCIPLEASLTHFCLSCYSAGLFLAAAGNIQMRGPWCCQLHGPGLGLNLQASHAAAEGTAFRLAVPCCRRVRALRPCAKVVAAATAAGRAASMSTHDSKRLLQFLAANASVLGGRWQPECGIGKRLAGRASGR